MNKTAREWAGYINQNKLEHADCQIVTAVNAYYYLTGDNIPQDSERYQHLVKLTAAKNGPALSIQKAWDNLEIEPYNYRYYPFFATEDKLPVATTIWHKTTGYHSVLIVDRIEECTAIRVTNFRAKTSLDGWLFEEDFQHYITNNIRKTNSIERCWSFRLKENNV